MFNVWNVAFLFLLTGIRLLFVWSPQNSFERELVSSRLWIFEPLKAASLLLLRPFVLSSVFRGVWDTDLTHVLLDLYGSKCVFLLCPILNGATNQFPLVYRNACHASCFSSGGLRKLCYPSLWSCVVIGLSLQRVAELSSRPLRWGCSHGKPDEVSDCWRLWWAHGRWSSSPRLPMPPRRVLKLAVCACVQGL